ncbi:TPA: hypothetical protein ACWW9G_000456 [Klebsiella pneumoniae]|uniref:hypothetical protein n=1 Tax=Klebsiella pneumoniae TaxID=573 RepID=UPI001141C7D5|nr:hypothetical protein [Klebsiella pneumoniae]NBZ13551.1 hypothetical protein [Klebsiella pneumoniae]NBZ56015.1 hypothetical protein [Klebsiella pneumoniae]HBW9604153.1 hypothetical protein [Klebsiella pneumoniae]HBZ4069119.1 hypothetical protein [Klebsiella pneumoniae]HBZ4147022.1 hypothetical protein [Klebsiella pneumoniae]
MKYDENCIRVLTDEELESHSADSILEIILDEYPNTSPDHLAKVAECLVTLGYGVNEYREYRRGTLDNIKLHMMQEWFSNKNKESNFRK